MTSKEFEELLDDAYVASLPSDRFSQKYDDEEIAVEMLLMDSEGEFQQEDSEDDKPLSMLRTTLKKQVKEKISLQAIGLTQKAYRRAIMSGLTASTSASPNRVKSSSRRASSNVPPMELEKSKPYVPKEIRLTSSMHQPERTPRRRCALCSTKVHPVRIDWKCPTCEVPLCLGKEKTCSQTYHSN
ncbi:hypothetical protein JTB14_029833 [Gonioctena quinquepunctata]|nr:hypothetical protein JTB14_029833 [Gonioctena quinquepunctata]